MAPGIQCHNFPIEHGVPASTVAPAIVEREAEIRHLEMAVADLSEPVEQRLAIMPTWVEQQLQDTVGLLSGSPERTKAEFQRLGLRVTMAVKRGTDGRPFYQADVVNSLPCLSGISDLAPNQRAAMDRSPLQRAP